MKQLLAKLDDTQKAELLIELSTQDISGLDESNDFEIDLIAEYANEIKFSLNNWGKHQGIDWGFKSINDMTLGMTDGEVLLLSGDSNHGKTQMALNLAYAQAKMGNMVFFITLEMTQDQIGARIAKIGMQQGMTFEDAIGLPVTVQRTKRLDYRNVGTIVAQAKRNGASIVFLDHVHSFARSSSANKTTEIAAISMEIKRAALENNMPIVALAQCRKLEDHNGKPRKPNKNDLKDASELYQDCDMCIMVWRDKFSEGGRHANKVEARIWKNRLREMRYGHQIKNFVSVDGAMMYDDPTNGSEMFPKK
jgi:replicative DNA helicase